MLDRMVEEAATTSRIEGEYISREQLMSSLLNNLAVGQQRHEVRDMRASGITRQIDANRQTWAELVTATSLKYWHELLLGFDKSIRVVGDYRAGASPMQIISGPSHNQTIHLEAPPSATVKTEMRSLIDYCNQPATTSIEYIERAGVAHLWFESIHPFEDGNGRIGRALLEKLLSQGLRSFIPFSISHAIEANRKNYYAALQDSQTTLDISAWMVYYSNSLLQAVDYANTIIEFTIQKHRYYQQFSEALTEEEAKAVGKMFEPGPEGFRGGMSAKNYMSINRVSRATATRTLQRLTEIGALIQHGKGRSTHYLLPFGSAES